MVKLPMVRFCYNNRDWKFFRGNAPRSFDKPNQTLKHDISTQENILVRHGCEATLLSSLVAVIKLELKTQHIKIANWILLLLGLSSCLPFSHPNAEV